MQACFEYLLGSGQTNGRFQFKTTTLEIVMNSSISHVLVACSSNRAFQLITAGCWYSFFCLPFKRTHGIFQHTYVSCHGFAYVEKQRCRPWSDLQINMLCKYAAVPDQRRFGMFIINVLLGSWRNCPDVGSVCYVSCRLHAQQTLKVFFFSFYFWKTL